MSRSSPFMSLKTVIASSDIALPRVSVTRKAPLPSAERHVIFPNQVSAPSQIKCLADMERSGSRDINPSSARHEAAPRRPRLTSISLRVKVKPSTIAALFDLGHTGLTGPG